MCSPFPIFTLLYAVSHAVQAFIGLLLTSSLVLLLCVHQYGHFWTIDWYLFPWNSTSAPNRSLWTFSLQGLRQKLHTLANWSVIFSRQSTVNQSRLILCVLDVEIFSVSKVDCSGFQMWKLCLFKIWSLYICVSDVETCFFLPFLYAGAGSTVSAYTRAYTTHMHAYMHAYSHTHTHTHTRMHAHTHTHRFKHRHTHTRVYMHAPTHYISHHTTRAW